MNINDEENVNAKQLDSIKIPEKVIKEKGNNKRTYHIDHGRIVEKSLINYLKSLSYSLRNQNSLEKIKSVEIFIEEEKTQTISILNLSF